MRSNPRSRHHVFLGLGLVPVMIWLTIGAPIAHSAADPPPAQLLDCGVNALFLMAELGGRGVTLDQLDAALPRRHPDGYSMAELATAAKAIGMPLDGIQFGNGEGPLDRPAIAFLKNAKTGHFVVLRPIGSTGKMVQVLDPPHTPRVVDYAEFTRLPSWTGRGLIRADPWVIRNAAPLLTGAAGSTLLVGLIGVRRRRGRVAAITLNDAGLAG